jgi:ParB family chromosome partitioning protein
MNDFARRGLGRGLSTLLGEPARADFAPQPHAYAPPPVVEPPPIPAPQPFTPTLVEATPAPEAAAEVKETLRTISVDLIAANPNQPRKHFDEQELRELADSIRTHGVLQPILVRPAKGQPGRYEIVAGERRWRAAQMAGVHAIPAVTRELEELDVLEIAIIENVQRTDLNPIEEAQGFQSLIDRFGRTQQEIADAVGKSRPHIANMLRLLALPEEILDMVRDGRLSAGHARAILTAPDPLALATLAVAQSLNVREIERLAQQAKEDKGLRAPSEKPEKDADTRALEETLAQVLGLGVAINAKGEGGEIRIAYKRLEQLDDIVARLRGGS